MSEQTEEEFLATYNPKDFFQVSFTADVVVFRRDPVGQSFLVIKRKNHPFKDKWALPGGFVEPTELPYQTAHRELLEETGVFADYLKAVGFFASPDRDPRGYSVSAAFTTLVSGHTPVVPGDDAVEALWVPVEAAFDTGEFNLNDLAFDHADILKQALFNRNWLYC